MAKLVDLFVHVSLLKKFGFGGEAPENFFGIFCAKLGGETKIKIYKLNLKSCIQENGNWLRGSNMTSTVKGFPYQFVKDFPTKILKGFPY